MVTEIKRNIKENPRAIRAIRAIRADGVETRDHILQIAGMVFAKNGFERATSKEICAIAGANRPQALYLPGSWVF